MARRAFRLILAGCAAVIPLLTAASALGAEGWKAGTARVAITPKQPMWMAGYGARNHPSEGVEHDLWAKALILESPAGVRYSLVTLDVCGIGRDLSVKVRDELKKRHGLTRDRVVIACSHTHCGPVLGSNLITMYPLDQAQRERVERYAEFAYESMVGVVGQAIQQLAPADVSWQTGRADFAVNRRENNQAKVEELRAKLQLKGPVDHDVPVLCVKGPAGKPLAIVFGYACHCTVLPYYKFCGDYAGFAQIALEKTFPGAQAMFVAGCGADQNPLPRGTVEHARRYGSELAQSVERVLAGPLNPVDPASISSAYEEISLPLGVLPSREQIEKEAQSKDLPLANRAKKLLKRIDEEGSLARTYPYPVQAWKLGGLTWVFLGGEVVVDYSLRLKRNLGSSHTWVSSYCNDVCAYIPSLRVLKEGGYEGATSMVYYGLPAPWGPTVEEDIVDAAGRLTGSLGPR
ncbi:MAG: neutral/alkaline non-lysosomal ceramidase N-terminal domain-containing protein [Isosphaeraceae bacterium]|nr:neutral/alkaline non-lysosomal ceramidase N-terminal domain-containing protein [Isosphaeraceae bacterium]